MIHRAESRTQFVRIDTETINDKRLSLEAKGLLVSMLACPDDWNFSLNGLIYSTGLCRDTVMKLVKELKNCGYIVQKRGQSESGRFTSCEWEVFEVPTTVGQNHTTEKPQYGKTTLRKNHSMVTPQYGKTLPIQLTNNIELTNNTKLTNDNNKRGEDFSEILASLPPELQDTFQDFIKMRKTIKAPMTEKALKLAVDKCRKLGNDNPETMRSIVEQSILNSWKGLFPLKEETKKSPEPIWENPFTKLRREEGFI